MEQATIIGIDLAKGSFQVHGARADGSVAFRKKLSRAKVLDFVASQPDASSRWRRARVRSTGVGRSGSSVTR